MEINNKYIKDNWEKIYLDMQSIYDSPEKDFTPDEKDQVEKVRSIIEQYKPKDYDRQLINTYSKDPQWQQVVNANPEKLFKILYDVDKNNELGINDKKIVRSLLTATQLKLMDKNINPQDLIEVKSKPIKALETIGNAFMIPVNLTTGAISLAMGGKGTKIWGGKGWDDFIHEVQYKDPEVKTITEKVVYNEPLTEYEQKKYNNLKLQKKIGGTVGNIILDPTLVFSTPLKGVNLVSKGLTGAKTFKMAKIASNTDGLKYIDETIKGIGKYVTETAGKKLTPNQLKFFENIRNAKTGNIVKIRNAPNVLRQAGLEETADYVAKTISGMDDYIKTINKSKDFFNQPTIKAVEAMNPMPKLKGYVDKSFIGQGISNLREKSMLGLNKVFKPPLLDGKNTENVLTYEGDIYATKLMKSAKEMAKISGMEVDDVLKKIVYYNEPIDPVKKKEIADGIIKNIKFNTKKESDDFVKALDKSSKDFNDAMDSLIIKENIFEVPTIPLRFNEQQAIKWQELGDKFRKIQNENAYSTKLDDVQKEMKDMLNFNRKDIKITQKKAQSLLNKNEKIQITKADPFGYYTKPYTKPLTQSQEKVVEQLSEAGRMPIELKTVDGKDIIDPDAINYMLHMMTPEFRNFIKARNPNSISDLFDVDALDRLKVLTQKIPINHASTKKRLIYLGIQDANNISREGKLVTGFTGDIFQENPLVLLKTRYNRGAFGIRNSKIESGLRKLADTAPEYFKKKGDIIPKFYAPVSLKGEEFYVPNELSLEIKRLKDFTKSKAFTNNFLAGYDYITSLIKGNLTVGQFPFRASFFTRNLIGNIFNSMLSGIDTKNLYTGYRAAGEIMQANHKRIKDGVDAVIKGTVTTNAGKIYSYEDLFKSAWDNGIFGKGLVAETIQDIMNSQKYSSSEKMKQAGNLINNLFVNVKLGGRINQVLEDWSRLGLYIGRLKEGDTPLNAGIAVKKYLFDYQDLTEFERDVVKRIVPFYNWIKNNLVLQITNVFSPTTRGIMKGVDTWNENVDPEKIVDKRIQTEYNKNKPQLKLWKDEGRQQETALNLQGLVPTYDILSVLSPEGIQETASSINPVIDLATKFGANWDIKKGERYSKSKFDKKSTLGLQLPKFASDLISLTPLRYLDDYNPGNIFGDDTKLSYSGNINTDIQKTGAEKAWMATLGSPLKYDATTAKVIADRDINYKMITELSSLRSKIQILDKRYSGKEFPVNDMKEIAERMKYVIGVIKEGYNTGVLDPDDIKLNNTLKSTVKEWAKFNKNSMEFK
jgi:hypothetical protein